MPAHFWLHKITHPLWLRFGDVENGSGLLGALERFAYYGTAELSEMEIPF